MHVIKFWTDSANLLSNSCSFTHPGEVREGHHHSFGLFRSYIFNCVTSWQPEQRTAALWAFCPRTPASCRWIRRLWCWTQNQQLKTKGHYKSFIERSKKKLSMLKSGKDAKVSLLCRKPRHCRVCLLVAWVTMSSSAGPPNPCHLQQTCWFNNSTSNPERLLRNQRKSIPAPLWRLK